MSETSVPVQSSTVIPSTGSDESALAMARMMGAPNKANILLSPQAPAAPSPQPAAQVVAPVAPLVAPQAPVAPAANPELIADPNATVLKTALGDLSFNTTPAAAPAPIGSFDEAFASPAFKSAFGMEVSNPQEFIDKVVPQALEWRGKAAKAGEFEAKYNNVISSVKILPSEIKDAVNTFYEDQKAGTEHWREKINTNQALTFKEPVNKVPKELLVNTFFPNKFTAEELSDPDNKSVEIAYESSQREYTNTQTARANERASKELQAQQLRDAVSASIHNSIQGIGSQIPIKIDQGRVSEAEQMMSDGSWISLFVNEDGTFKENAGSAIIMAKHGAPTFGAMIEHIEKRTASTIAEGLVDKASVTQVTGSGAGNVVQKTKAAEGEDVLRGLMSQPKPFFS